MKKGYKILNFGFDTQEKNIEKTQQFVYNKKDDNSDDDHLETKKKKTKKKASIISNAYSAFDSNLNIDQKYLNSIFIDNEFDSITDDSYIVYLELKDIKTERIIAFRIKYDSNFEFFRAESLPIKWMSIDLRNLSDEHKKDIRFSLLSDREVATDVSEIIKQIKQSVISLNGENARLVVSDDFKQSDVFVRHSKSVKYKGNIENWKPIFHTYGLTLLESKWLEEIKVAIADVDEFSENDENGSFKVSTNRKELVVSAKLDVKSLKITEFKELTDLMWHISQIFQKLLY